MEKDAIETFRQDLIAKPKLTLACSESYVSIETDVSDRKTEHVMMQNQLYGEKKPLGFGTEGLTWQNLIMTQHAGNVLPRSGPCSSWDLIRNGKDSQYVQTMMPLKGSSTSSNWQDDWPGQDSFYLN